MTLLDWSIFYPFLERKVNSKTKKIISTILTHIYQACKSYRACNEHVPSRARAGTEHCPILHFLGLLLDILYFLVVGNDQLVGKNIELYIVYVLKLSTNVNKIDKSVKTEWRFALIK